MISLENRENCKKKEYWLFLLSAASVYAIIYLKRHHKRGCREDFI
jgi:hypothetical protein